MNELHGPVHQLDPGRYYAVVRDGVPMIERADTAGAVLAVEPAATPEYVRAPSKGQDLAIFDQLHAEALERLRGAHSFLLFLRGDDIDGTLLYVCAPDGELDGFSQSAQELLEKLRRDQGWDT